MKLCKDCKHYENIGAYELCTRKVPSIVSGTKSLDIECKRYRRDYPDCCGTMARYYEPSLWARFKQLFKRTTP